MQLIGSPHMQITIYCVIACMEQGSSSKLTLRSRLCGSWISSRIRSKSQCDLHHKKTLPQIQAKKAKKFDTTLKLHMHSPSTHQVLLINEQDIQKALQSFKVSVKSKQIHRSITSEKNRRGLIDTATNKALSLLLARGTSRKKSIMRLVPDRTGWKVPSLNGPPALSQMYDFSKF